MKYKVVTLPNQSGSSHIDLWEQAMTDSINNITEQGWQLLQIASIESSIVAVFSRK